MDLSICMIVKNEEKNLVALLPQLQQLDCELCIVDTGSHDRTPQLIQQYTGTCPTFDWCDDFSKARNYSLTLATKNSVLWLDGDDRLHDQTLTQLKILCDNPVKKAYACIIENPREGMSEPERFRQLRIFPNNQGLEFTGVIHEELRTACYAKGVSIVDSEITIEHTGYYYASDRLEKTERNYQLLKKEYDKNNDDLFVVMEYGNALYQKKQYESAIAVYEEGYSNPRAEKNTHAYITLPLLIGNTYEILGNKIKALEWFEISMITNPKALTAHYKVARSLFVQNRFERSLELLLKIRNTLEGESSIGVIAQSNEALLTNSYTYSALIFLKQKEYYLAVTSFEKIINQKDITVPFDPWLYVEGLIGAEKYSPAQSALKKFTLSPSNMHQYHLYAKMLIGLGNFADAIELYQQLLVQNRENVSYINEYGICLFQTGAVRDAQQCFFTALELSQTEDVKQNICDTIVSLQNKQFALERIAHITIPSEQKSLLSERIKGLYAEC